MKVILSGDVYIIVLEKGEYVMESLKKFAKEHDFCGFIIGIGALESPKIGFFDTNKKIYETKEFIGDYELTSLVGNIGRLENGEIALHVHITLGDSNYNIFGGHLIDGKVAVTLEIFATRTKCFVRRKDDYFGLNLIHK